MCFRTGLLRRYAARNDSTLGPLVILLCLPLLSACGYISPSEKQTVLQTHNALRARHGSPPLTWNHELALYAGLHASRCRFHHSQIFGRYGQNLVAGSSSPAAGVRAWYSEIQYYDYTKPRFSKKTGHFTQLIWKSSRELGCAWVNCGGKNGTPGHFLVCNYTPPGNVVNPGYFAANVLALRFKDN